MNKPLKKPTIGAQAMAFAEGDKPTPEKAPKDKTVRVNANIQVELHKALKVRAANEGTTIGALIEGWIKNWAKK